jgi:hypothetical protein
VKKNECGGPNTSFPPSAYWVANKLVSEFKRVSKNVGLKNEQRHKRKKTEANASTINT